MTLPSLSGPVWTIKTGRFSGHGRDRIYKLPDVSGPEVAEPVEVVPAERLWVAIAALREIASSENREGVTAANALADLGVGDPLLERVLEDGGDHV